MSGRKAYLFVFLLLACQDQASTTQNRLETSESENSENANVESKVAEIVTTCAELEIPSWEKRVFRLSRDLCEKCHNTDFAWNGLILNSYENFTKNAEASIERIRSQNLSFSMNPIEIAVFLDWYEAGMPRSESDCQPISDEDS